MNRIEQIVFTATQFEGVEGVVIKINGVERSTIGPDGLALARPLTRARR
jgi:spore germination protein GerM